MESFQQDIIERCKNSSQNINDYFNEERYRSDVDQNEEITPDFLVHTAVDMVLEELKEMGIECNYDAQELINTPVDLETMFYLRNKFDKDNFYKLLKIIDEKTYSIFSSIVEDVEVSEDYLINITSFFYDLIPKDIGWDYIGRCLNHWFSNDDFGAHISAIMQKIDASTDPNKVYISDENITVVKAFLDIMNDREQRLNLLAGKLFDKYPIISRSRLQTLIDRYDKDKLNPDILPYFAEYSRYDHTEDEDLPSFVIEHHKKASHHIEYWSQGVGFARKQFITTEHACIIVLSEVLENKDQEYLLSYIEKFKPFCVDTVFAFMQELCKVDYTDKEGE